jgi:transposase InsO family protein
MSRAIRQKLGWSYKKDAGCHRARRREKERFQGAPIEDSSDTDSFGLYVREILVPRLKSGQIVLMDNLSVHTSGWARELIEERGCELWLLPAYSPDMNPIEKPSPR